MLEIDDLDFASAIGLLLPCKVVMIVILDQNNA